VPKNLLLIIALGMLCSSIAHSDEAVSNMTEASFDEEAIIKEAKELFGKTSEELAKVVAKAFKEHGKPNAYIKGEETGGAIAIGLRRGQGILHTATGKAIPVKWQGPSIGFEIGISASKVLTLVYHLPHVSDIYQRFNGVEGSLYFVAGIGINYLKKDDIVLAPIRAGVGWRHGANVGYVKFSPDK